jgi:hypothetical protein
MTKHDGLPVSGYRQQPQENVDLVNGFKADEERILRKLELLPSQTEIDGRWLAIGKTQLEQAFMAINRAIFQPGRVQLPEDAATTWQERAKKELAELVKHKNKLHEFMDTAAFAELTAPERLDLNEQLKGMALYAVALRSRLSRAGENA